MGVVVVSVIGGLLVGLARGGSLARLGGVRLAGVWLLLAALAAQVFGTVLAAFGPLASAGAAYAAGLVTSTAFAGVFLLRHRRVPGVALIALGLLMNTLAVVANAAMPVSLTAATRAGVATGALLDDPRHEPAGSTTRLRLLTDVLPVPLPGLPQVISVGDVLVAAGAAQLVAAAACAGRLTRARWQLAIADRRRVRPAARRGPHERVRPWPVPTRATHSTRRRRTWQSASARPEPARRKTPTTASGRTPDPDGAGCTGGQLGGR